MNDSNLLIRNRINFLIDGMLDDNLMIELRTYLNKLKPFVANDEDALLGFVFGYMSADAVAFLGNLQIAITDEEINIMMDAFIKRIADVKRIIFKSLEENRD